MGKMAGVGNFRNQADFQLPASEKEWQAADVNLATAIAVAPSDLSSFLYGCSDEIGDRRLVVGSVL
jgi:hypothetical protein